MLVVKWSEKVKGPGDKIYAPVCGGLYKEEDKYIVHWPGTYPCAKMNCFTCSIEDNDWIVPGDRYNK